LADALHVNVVQQDKLYHTGRRPKLAEEMFCDLPLGAQELLPPTLSMLTTTPPPKHSVICRVHPLKMLTSVGNSTTHTAANP
jgi:hypothetical protein